MHHWLFEKKAAQRSQFLKRPSQERSTMELMDGHFYVKHPTTRTGRDTMAGFVTAINCIDGRVQSPVAEYLKARFGVQYVDMITCPGPVAVLSHQHPPPLLHFIEQSVRISLTLHNSAVVALVAHHDCAANVCSDALHVAQLRTGLQRLHQWGLPAQLVGLWVSSSWQVEEKQFTETITQKEGWYAVFCND
jgi:hypothetical protein